MIDDLKQYAATGNTKFTKLTSDINIPWLTQIPSHWSYIRSKHLFTARKERAQDGDEQLSATQAFGVIPQQAYENKIGRRVVRITQHLEKRAHVEKNDFVISMRSFQGGLERAWSTGCIRSSYVVLKPSSDAFVGYYAQLFKCHDYIRAIQATSNFIRDGQDLNFANFCMVDLPVPPWQEQIAIARFLDHANGKIERTIRAKRKLIALLNEQKKAIIHRAVTRGLDPNVKLKPSGIPWVGDVPEHWDKPLNQRIFKEDIRPHNGKSEVPLSLSQRSGLIATAEMQERSLKTSTYVNWKVTVPGDLVVNRFKAHLGVFFAATLRGIVSFHYGVFAPRRKLSTKYFELLYHTAPYCAIYAGRSNGMTVGLQNLSNQNFYNVRSIVPPFEEQLSIVTHTQNATAKLQQTIERIQREIDLLREYRTTLTADVVTGKLDVREAAKRLPAEATDLQQVDDLPDDEDILEETDA